MKLQTIGTLTTLVGLIASAYWCSWYTLGDINTHSMFLENVLPVLLLFVVIGGIVTSIYGRSRDGGSI